MQELLLSKIIVQILEQKYQKNLEEIKVDE